MQDLLKFITCGSVDDGKSTLIGHILYDSKLLYADQERALELDSRVGSRGGSIDYSLLLDGLMAEREQGITIDVAYRYFTTDRRSFIVADTPGHEEYTRNMAVGASFAQLAVILVDAGHGVLVQTRRHARICALMGIRYFVFALNKMDLISYDQRTFAEISAQIQALAAELELPSVQIIPVSATEGDNVTRRSGRMPWYDGPALLDYLETVNVEERAAEQGFYLPVQRVCRPDHTFRGFQGQIEAGEVAVGDTLTALPSGERARVRQLLVGDREATAARKGQPVTVQLDREVDISRGCVLERDSGLSAASEVTATLLWMDDAPLEKGRSFYAEIGTRRIPASVKEIRYAIDVNSGSHRAADRLAKNELAVCRIDFVEPVIVSPFDRHKTLGELILIDRITNATAACGVVRELQSSTKEATPIARLRAALKAQKPLTVVFRLNRGGISVPLLESAERQLTLSGRHTLLYLPAPGEPVCKVLEQLESAGLLVMLAAEEPPALPNALDWTREGASAGEIAAKLKRWSEPEQSIGYTI